MSPSDRWLREMETAPGLEVLDDPRWSITHLLYKYLDLGWQIIPQCFPDLRGHCACPAPYDHDGRRTPGEPIDASRVGKIPLLKSYREREATAENVRDWWGRWPLANVALNLEDSGLVCIDLDGPAAVAEAERLGLPPTHRILTHKGYHALYRRPEDTPCRRRTHLGESEGIDLLSSGLSTLPPSRHRKGHVYSWRWHEGPIPYPPDWALAQLELDYAGPDHKPAWMQNRMDVTAQGKAVMRNPNHTRRDWVEEAVSYIDPDGYETWLRVGMALFAWDSLGNGDGDGFDVWDSWSSAGDGYPGREKLREKWLTFGARTSIGSLYGMAKDRGYAPEHRAARDTYTPELETSTTGVWTSTTLVDALGGSAFEG